MKKILITVTILMISFSAYAQEFLSNFTWNIGLPVSKTSEFTSDVSYRGFSFSWQRFMDKQNTLGITVGWNIFDEKNFDPINIQTENGSGTISGTQVRTVNAIPLLAGAHHYFGERREMRVFLGFNAGMYYILQRLNVGVNVFDNDNWHFGIAPDAGLIIPIFEGNYIFYLGSRYNYAFDSGTAFGGAEDNFYSYWEVNIGFTFSSQWF